MSDKKQEIRSQQPDIKPTDKPLTSIHSEQPAKAQAPASKPPSGSKTK